MLCSSRMVASSAWARSISRRRAATLFRAPQASAVPLWSTTVGVVVAVTTTHYNFNSPSPGKTCCEAIAPPTTAALIVPREVLPLKQKIVKALRMFARIVKLMFALGPLILLFPLLHSSAQQPEEVDAHQVALEKAGGDVQLSWFARRYLELCLRSVEWSGAAVIKLMQWLSSRPDLVGHDFCSIFSRLQDDTTPHKWKYTERALKEAYGDDWATKIRIDKLIGSGCIGQVYKGYVKQNSESDEEIPVAIKVLHPAIDQDMETDLDILHVLAHYLPRISTQLSWLNPQGAVNEFGRMLTSQLDLRHEAYNLKRFNKEFENDDSVRFPKLIDNFPSSHNVLVETFLEGIPILEFAKRHRDDTVLLKAMCVAGIRTVCKMIFWNNHCHGDLHPGNVLVSPDNKLILLDVGISNEYTDVDHQLIVDVLTSFIRYDGTKAGQLLIDNSNLGRNEAVEEDAFCKKINAMTTRASGEDYLMEHLGTYISEICDAAARHHVLMNQSFVSAALAIKVQEGIVLALDPAMKIYKVANPIILEGEARRRVRNVFGGGGDDGENKQEKRSLWERLTGFQKSSLPKE